MSALPPIVYGLSPAGGRACSLLGTLAGHLTAQIEPSTSSSLGPIDLTQGSGRLNYIKLQAWDKIKENLPKGPLDLSQIIDAIEKEHFSEETDLETKVSKVDSLFHQLGKKLASEFDAAGIPEENRTISEAHLTTLQDRLLHQLLTRNYEKYQKKVL